MKIITASFEVLDFPENAIEKICIAARTCYQSEPKNDKSNENLVRKLISSGHHTPLEFASSTVRIVCDRGVSHELVRHRLASFQQSSTRYCNYTKDKFNNQITVIKPSFWQEGSKQYTEWYYSMCDAEERYITLINSGATPEEARSVLPMSLKTEIVMSCNFRELRHILDLRCSAKAHIQIREIMIPLLKECYARCPVIFEDIYQKYCLK